MGLLDPRTVIGIINGKISGLVFARMRDGRVVVRHRPVRESAQIRRRNPRMATEPL